MKYIMGYKLYESYMINGVEVSEEEFFTKGREMNRIRLEEEEEEKTKYFTKEGIGDRVRRLIEMSNGTHSVNNLCTFSHKIYTNKERSNYADRIGDFLTMSNNDSSQLNFFEYGGDDIWVIVLENDRFDIVQALNDRGLFINDIDYIKDKLSKSRNPKAPSVLEYLNKN